VRPAAAKRNAFAVSRSSTRRLRYSKKNWYCVNEEFRLLVEAVQDYAIFMLDPAGKVTTCNVGAERIKQYAAREIQDSVVEEREPGQHHMDNALIVTVSLQLQLIVPAKSLRIDALMAMFTRGVRCSSADVFTRALDGERQTRAHSFLPPSIPRPRSTVPANNVPNNNFGQKGVSD
jgi:PAS domain-containing protein